MAGNPNLSDYKHFKLIEEDVFRFYRAEAIQYPEKEVVIKVPVFNSIKDNEILVREFETLSYLRDFQRKMGRGKNRRKPGSMKGIPTSMSGGFPERPPNFSHIPLVVALERTENDTGYALICEYFEGKSMRSYLPSSSHVTRLSQSMDAMSRLTLEEKTNIAYQVIEVLEFMHRASYAYLNLSPDSIFIKFQRDGTIRIELQNFSHASTLNNLYTTKPTTKNVYYMSPEQIEAFGIAVDHRADIYCLGLLLWELFAEEHPYQYHDFQEIANCQLLQPTRNLHELNDNIPFMISEIANKCLIKDRNFRYQMTKSIKDDFGKIMAHVKEFKTVHNVSGPMTDNEYSTIFKDFVFPIGSTDLSLKIQIAKKTYGRKAQVKQMLEVFDRWYSADQNERSGVILNLNGPIGIGKSSFLQELSTYGLADGKLQGVVAANIPLTNFSIPLVGVCSILDQLVANMLLEPTSVVRSWEMMIKRSLNVSQLRTLADLVPKLSFITEGTDLNSSLPSPQFDDSEFHRIIQVFLCQFCSYEEPLLLCFDSLQAGPGTIPLLKYLVASPLGKRCFFLGYSDNGEDVVAKRTDITSEMVATELRGINFETIHIPYLNVTEIEEFLRDILNPSSDDFHAFAKVLTERTKGNYLLLREYVFFCEKKGLIAFDFNEVHWKWDLHKIRSNLEISNGEAVDIVMNQFKELPQACQTTLKFAACIGMTFETSLLSDIMKVPQIVIMSDLSLSISGGYIVSSNERTHFREPSFGQNEQSFHEMSIVFAHSVPLRSSTTGADIEICDVPYQSFKFCNETLYENIRKCIPRDEFEQISLLIARNLVLKCGGDGDLSLLDIVRHYDACISILVDPEEILKVAKYNAILGQKYASDFGTTAAQYFENAERLFERIDSKAPELIQTKFYLAKFYLLSADNYARVCEIVESLDHLESKDSHIKCQTDLLRMCLLLEKQQYREAFSTLTSLGFSLDDKLKSLIHDCPTSQLLLQYFTMIMRKTEQKLTIIEIPFRDYIFETLIIAARICAKHGDEIRCCYFKLLNLFLFWWTEPDSEVTGKILSNLIPFYLGKACNHFDVPFACELVKKLNLKLDSFSLSTQAFSLQVLIQGAFECTHNDLYSKMAEKTLLYVRNGKETLAAIIQLKMHIFLSLPFGKSLTFIMGQQRKFHHQFENVDLNESFEISTNICRLIAEGNYSVGAFSAETQSQLHSFIPYASALDYMLYEKFNCPDMVESLNLDNFAGTVMYVDCLLFQIIKQLHPLKEDKEVLKNENHTLNDKLGLIQQLTSRHYGGDQKFKYSFAKAEMEACQDNVASAIRNYELAAESATLAGNHLFAAWINERFANFWNKLSLPKMAKPYILAALNQYEKWGGEAKCAELSVRHPNLLKTGLLTSAYNLLGKSSTPRGKGTRSRNTSESSEEPFFAGTRRESLGDLDVKTVLKATNSITNEVNLTDLIKKILQQMISNTGSTKAALFLNENSNLKLAKLVTAETTLAIAHVEEELQAPLSIVFHVFRTLQDKVISNQNKDPLFENDPYIEAYNPKSMLCCPIKHQNIVTGILYLENRNQVGNYSPLRLFLVKSLLASASISIANALLVQTNEKLARALQDSNFRSEYSRNSVETPIQKVLDAVKGVKERFDQDDPILITLDDIMVTLTSSGLFSANLEKANDRDGQIIDQDTKNWIENSLLMTPSYSFDSQHKKKHKSVEFSSKPVNIQTDLLINNPSESVRSQLDICSTPEFDVFYFSEITSGQPLTFLACELMQKHHLANTFKMDLLTVQSYFQAVESHYNNLPYHNNIHGADVLQNAELLLTGTELSKSFSPVEIFALLLGAAVHDIDHPGLNNNFLIQTKHPMAMLYNDYAVLENHHISLAFDIAKTQKGCDIFSSLTSDQLKQLRALVIKVVLATDMSRHFQVLSQFKGKNTSDSLSLDDDADRVLIMEMVIKCADLGNPVKLFDAAKEWTAMIMEEFFLQGDKEKQLGLPVTKFYDRTDTDISKCQVGFIDFLVSPLYEAWYAFSDTPYTRQCIQNLSDNREQWRVIMDPQQIFTGIKNNTYAPADQLLEMTIPTLKFCKKVATAAPRKTSVISTPTGRKFSRSSIFRRNSLLPTTDEIKESQAVEPNATGENVEPL